MTEDEKEVLEELSHVPGQTQHQLARQVNVSPKIVENLFSEGYIEGRQQADETLGLHLTRKGERAVERT